MYLSGCSCERYANAIVDAAGLIPFRRARLLGNLAPTGNLLNFPGARVVGGFIRARLPRSTRTSALWEHFC